MQMNSFGLRTILLCSVFAAPASANDLQTGFGSFMEQHHGFTSQNTDGFDILTEDEFFHRPSITLDNGIKISARMDFEETDDGGVDEPLLRISGSFGSILLGEDDLERSATTLTLPNVDFLGINSGSAVNFLPFNSCTGQSDSGSPTAIRYFTPRFAGFQLGVSYARDLNSRTRGALATQNGANLVNPALNFEYKLEGTEYGVSAGYCIDTARILPSFVTFGYYNSDFSGSASIQNQNFNFGLGVTSPGGTPGVFVNSPTDLQWGTFQADRSTNGLNVAFEHPFRFSLKVPQDGARPSMLVFSLLGAIEYGMIDQLETVQVAANSPAFAPNSNWTTSSRTQFDSDTLGIKVGLAATHINSLPGNLTETLRLAGTIGYTNHSVKVTDSVQANGLGGLLNFNNTQINSYDDGVSTASFNASYGRQYKNISFNLGAGIDYGNYAAFDYHRVDNIGGVAVPASLRMVSKPVFKIGAGFHLRF